MNHSTGVATELTALELSVLEVALALAGGTRDEYRKQIEAATVSARTMSGVGFLTKLEVPEALAMAGDLPEEMFPAVTAQHPELPAGAEFVLQIKAGRLNTIEAFCFEGMWPGDESLFRVGAGS